MAAGAQQLQHQMETLVSYLPGMSRDTITNFEFQVGTTPLSGIHFPLVTVICFCIGIPLLQRFMKDRESPPLKYLLLVHNVFLSAVSGFMALFIIVTLMAKSDTHTPFEIFCSLNHHEQSGTLTFLYYVNYLLKYYELLDTIFLSLKHKNIGFLHAYHHPATLVLTWGQLVDSTGVQWVVILLNLFVHTVMYFYYTMSILKVKMPWKKLVTLMQIIQFVLDLFACYTAWMAYHFFGKCFGTNRAGIVGIFILTSYLFLFVDFYQVTYSKKKKDQMRKLKVLKKKQ